MKHLATKLLVLAGIFLSLIAQPSFVQAQDTTEVYCDGAYSVQAEGGGPIREGSRVVVTFNGSNAANFGGGAYSVGIKDGDGSNWDRFSWGILGAEVYQTGENGNLTNFTTTLDALPAGDHILTVGDANILGTHSYCETRFTVCRQDATTCNNNVIDTVGSLDAALTDDYVEDFNYCNQAPPGAQREACRACVEGFEGKKIYTAIGCIRTSGSGLTEDLVGLLIGISGGIALLTILAGSFLLATSQGEVSKVKKAKEMITASVMGILFIIFSVTILDFIGVKILRIPGLG